VAPTWQSLFSQQPFYVAHRGGGGNWPEMTGYAYEQSAKIPGLQAMEISACLTADGVLVCSHDEDTERLTGKDYEIGKETWATLSRLQVSAEETNRPSQPSQALTRFDEVAERYMGTHVLFVEPKLTAAVQPLMSRMIGLGRPEGVVWKQPVNSTTFPAARQLGFATWGYVLDEPGHLGDNLRRFAASPDITLIGASRRESDRFITGVVEEAHANGKPAISWEVRSVADRRRLLGLGVDGLMTSNVTEVLATPL
jgi:glycerophosphoryl diester phosphodiesterase